MERENKPDGIPCGMDAWIAMEIPRQVKRTGSLEGAILG